MQDDPEQGPPETRHGVIPPEWGLTCCRYGYQLAGLTTRRCPECGEPFDVSDTIRANRRSSWAYLMENRATPSGYPVFQLMKALGVSPERMESILRWSGLAFYGVGAVMGILMVLMAWRDFFVVPPLILLVLDELFIAGSGWGRFWLRVFLWPVCFVWATLVWWL